MKFLPVTISALLICLSAARSVPVHEVLAGFARPPTNPLGPLVEGPDGYLWGTTFFGGANGSGAVYKVNPANGEWREVVSFSGPDTPGSRPRAGLANDGAGFLWGTTAHGGETDSGTVFKIEASTGRFTTVTHFTGVGEGGNGGWVEGGMTADGAGYLWGTTSRGGQHSRGSVFKINAATGVLTQMASFTGTSGESPGNSVGGNLMNDGEGFIWGITGSGGKTDDGTVFKVETATGKLTTVIEFTGDGPVNKGSRPNGGLVSDGAGFLWGTTSGTVFKINRATGGLTTMAMYGEKNPDFSPSGPLVKAGGFFWGVMPHGGVSDTREGSVFKINMTTGAVSTVAWFNRKWGDIRAYRPQGGLVADSLGRFWGVTSHGGPTRWGAVFRFTPETRALETMIDFTQPSGKPAGHYPAGGLTGDAEGNLWGTTGEGGAGGAGTVFKYDRATGTFSTVAHFAPRVPASGEASQAATGLLSTGDGMLWGTKEFGGKNGLGSVYKVNTATGAMSTVADFESKDGSPMRPGSALVQSGDGFLWGASWWGGGSVFKINRQTGMAVTVFSFKYSDEHYGYYPRGRLADDGAGYLWGVNERGESLGLSGYGAVYKVNAATGELTRVLLFTGSGGEHPGASPRAGLTPDGTGFLWGTTAAGGPHDCGTVYKINIATGAFSSVVAFTGNEGNSRGKSPEGELVMDGAGFLWGTTYIGGTGGGTVFKINRQTGEMSTVLMFSGTGLQANAGAGPRNGSLLLHTDGHFYGMTVDGGPWGGGTLYRLRMGPVPVTMPAAPEGPEVTLHGTVNPKGNVTEVSFEYGTDPSLAGAQVVSAGVTVSGMEPEAVSARISGLVPGTTYYYRVLGLNAENPHVQKGAILSFTTAPAAPGGFTQWIKGFDLPEEDATPEADPDGDRLPNAVEYVLGGDPAVFSPEVGPAAAYEQESLVFTFRRSDLSEAPGITVAVETGADPDAWSAVYHTGADTASSSPGVTVTENGDAPDTVTVVIPAAAATRLYARLKVTVSPG